MQYIQVGENDLLKRRVYLHLVDATDGITAKTGQTGNCQISINGNPPTTSVNAIVEIDSTNLPGDYYVILNQTEIKTMGVVMVRFKNSAVAEFVNLVSVIAFDPYVPISLQPGFNQAVAPDIDYKRITKLVQETVALIPKPEPVDLEPLLTALHDVYAAIAAIHIPEPEKLDLSTLEAKLEPMEGHFADLAAQVKAIKIPVPDFQPLFAEIKRQTEALVATIAEGHQALSKHLEKGREANVEAVHKASSELVKRPITLNITPQTEPVAPEPPKRNYVKEYLNLKSHARQ